MLLRGVIDACTVKACRFCPDWDRMGARDCMDVVNWAEIGEESLLRELYRFSAVKIVGRAKENKEDVEPNPDIADSWPIWCASAYCPSSLTILGVSELLERRPASMVKDGAAPLEEVQDERFMEIYIDDIAKLREQARKRDIRIFRQRGVNLAHINSLSGITFVCRRVSPVYGREEITGRFTDPRDEVWPVKKTDLLDSPGNSYRCSDAQPPIGNVGWTFSPVSDLLFE